MNIRKSAWSWPRVLPALMLTACAASAWSQNGANVGEASFVIGVARISGADGSTKTIARGAVIRVGDRIETEAGGHVHVRFVDGGQLSVRPESRLMIEDYRHDARSSTQSAIKFRLDEGVVRSVTGSWGEAARERFRLNTPIAAIGIKGTDFIVKAAGDAVYASVNSGAIVLAPLDASCQATLGPCQNGREQLLTAAMRGKMLEMNGTAGTPRLVPAVELMPLDKHSAAEGRSGERMSAPRVENVHADPEVTKVHENETQGALAEQEARMAAANTPHVVPPAAVTPPPVVTPEPPPVVVAPPPPPPVITPPVVEQLAWVRLGSPKPGDTISKSFEEARETGHQAVIGNITYTLYRPPTLGAVLNVAETSANFRLAGATAQLHAPFGNQVDAVQVNGGTLSVDFAHSTFATGLNLSSERTGNVSIAADGTVRSDGVFWATSGNARVVGALTLDGKEAGYLFEKALSQGALQGVTLWGR